MNREPKRVALAWIYRGSDPAARLETIRAGEDQPFELIAVGNRELRRVSELCGLSRPEPGMRALDTAAMDPVRSAAGDRVEALVLWVDDGKPVGPGFIQDMARPVLSLDRHLHYWEGNALAVSSRVGEILAVRDTALRNEDLLALMSDIVDHGARLGPAPIRLLVSPIERFCAMAMEPLGLAS